jgi:hypothetical protein
MNPEKSEKEAVVAKFKAVAPDFVEKLRHFVASRTSESTECLNLQ